MVLRIKDSFDEYHPLLLRVVWENFVNKRRISLKDDQESNTSKTGKCTLDICLTVYLKKTYLLKSM